MMPVKSGWETDLRTMMPGAIFSTGLNCLVSMGPLPSTGLPSASTVRPRRDLPTGTERSFPVVKTSSPSLSWEMSPSTTQPTSSSSRLSAMPMAPPGNWTISLYITSERPSILATPSARVRMVPVFFLTALLESLAICCSICSRTVLMARADRVGF